MSFQRITELENKALQLINDVDAWEARAEINGKLARKYQDERDALASELTTLKAQNEKLLKAVRFYADKKSWEQHVYSNRFKAISSVDCEVTGEGNEMGSDTLGGKLARQALKDIEEGV